MLKLHKLLPALALAAILHTSANAQLTPLQDPANLAGERVSPQDPADTLPLNHGAPALQQLFAKLRTRASLMLIVAHPDDEDGGLLTYESRGQGARVAMLTLTRGEGGQNLMSADFDDALGLIRTQELLAADRYFGVDQFFGTEVDFGFSKTKEESFQKWTHDRVLYDAVRAVRLYRPLVLASVFVGGPTDGHGQHQVAGEIAQEVFVAAADPNVFPEMIQQGLLPWAPLKVYARVPFSRVTPEGMYDYATGKTVPTRFHNYVTGEDSTAVPTATVLIHEGDKPADPTLAAAMGGDTFLQFARKGLALQKTQIGPNARLAPAGAFDAPYTLIATRLGCIDTKPGCPTFAAASSSLRWASIKPTAEQSLFDGIDTSLSALATLAPDAPASLRSTLEAIDKHVAEAQRLFNPGHLQDSAPPLLEALRKVDALITSASKYELTSGKKELLLRELRTKRVQLNNAMVLSYDLDVSRILMGGKEPYAPITPGSQVSIRGGIPTVAPPLSFKRSVFTVGTGGRYMEFPTLAEHNTISDLHTSVRSMEGQAVIGLDASPTRPYFHRSNTEEAAYTVDDANLRNAPQTPAPFAIAEEFDCEGTLIEVKSVDLSNTSKAPSSPVPSVIVPRLSVEMVPNMQIISNQITDKSEAKFIVSVRTNVADIPPRVEVESSQGWRVNAPPDSRNDFKLVHVDDVETIRASFVPTEEQINRTIREPLFVQAYAIDLKPGDNRREYAEGYRAVGYPGLTYTNYFSPARLHVVPVDLHTAPNLRVAYLPGTGDPVPDFLPNLGITPTVLTLKDLTPTTLNKYDAILLGVRAYAAHPGLAGPGSQPLLDYAKQGGVVILQYMTARYGNAEAAFPIDVPGDPAHNVVEEAQPVTLLHPDAPLLTWPNKITAADFDGWVAERGHGFAATWSTQYQALLETHDVGQDPQQGGLLLARTGKGAYIYCALALYRQLPEGVPGAYRLLANLLSLAKNPGFQAH